MTNPDTSKLRSLLSEAVTSAKLLQANAIACAQNHHGEDFSLHGMPGWLTDTQRGVDALAESIPGLIDEVDRLGGLIAHHENRADEADAEADRLRSFLSAGSIQMLQSEQAWRRRALAAEAKVKEAEGVIADLAKAEEDYRYTHDVHGDGHSKTGRAWDLMRRAGHRARQFLTQEPTHEPS